MDRHRVTSLTWLEISTTWKSDSQHRIPDGEQFFLLFNSLSYWHESWCCFCFHTQSNYSFCVVPSYGPKGAYKYVRANKIFLFSVRKPNKLHDWGVKCFLFIILKWFSFNINILFVKLKCFKSLTPSQQKNQLLGCDDDNNDTIM